MKTGTQFPFWLFVVLCFLALLVPFGVRAVSPVAGILVGIVFPILWLALMPKTCRSGGFMAFPLSVLQLGAGLGWLAFGVRFLTR
jgi:hypothetical protein